MNLGLEGKNVLITGASKGIGRATADALAAEGCNLVLVARTAADLEVAKTSIRSKTDVSVESVACDLSISDNINLLAERFPDVEVLINNAGAIPGGSLLQVDEAAWRRAWDLKVFGYINMCRVYYRKMQTRRSGVIINVVGNAAQTHDPQYICGVAGNAALTAFSQSLGSVSPADGIRVVAVNPGPVATEHLKDVFRQRAAEAGESSPEDPFKSLPFGRASKPEEIAAAIAFLASSHSGYVSGSVMTIDAGLSARAHFS
jgi:3-oxoacyl-[acyl-carrier protein] reductase